MTPTQIEQAAQRHAELHFIDEAKIYMTEPWDKARDRYAKTLADFAKWCMKKQWISVDERLPEHSDYVLAHVPQRILPAYNEVSYYDGEDWYTQDGERIRPTYWMEIPKFNPEKE